MVKILIAEIKRNIEYYFKQPHFNAISKLEYVNEDGADTATYTVRYNATFIDDYETTSPNEIKFEFKAAKKSS